MESSNVLIPYLDKKKFYAELNREIAAFADPIWFTALANASASLKQHLPDVNWAGFYLMRNNELVLGPFQGLPACVRIATGKGVCGTAASERRSIVVKDVDQFPGHIACDSASRSEVVIPMIVGERILGVLDIDSPSLDRFDDDDRIGLELVVATLLKFNVYPAEF
jgi:L-methionine (R)-S-oxide reductase